MFTKKESTQTRNMEAEKITRSWVRVLATLTSLILIISTLTLGSATTTPRAEAGTPGSGVVTASTKNPDGTYTANWSTWTGNSGQVFTTWFGDYNNAASPLYHKVPIIDENKIYGIVYDRGLFAYDIAPDGVTVTLTRIGERAGENLTTLAVDGHRQERLSKDNLYYMWAWDGRTLWRVPENSNTAERLDVPRPSDIYSNAGQGWSGGEVIQKTGELFLSGYEGYRLSTSDNCMNSSSGEAFVMMIVNPETGEYRYSGKICPHTPSDAVTHNDTRGGRVSSDMALDGAGNAYILVQEGSDSTKRAALMRVVPAPVDAPNTPWSYNRVKGGISLGNQWMAWGMAFHNGKLYTGREYYDTYYDIINPLSGERQAFNGSTSLWTQDFAATQTAMVIDGTVYNDTNGNGSIETSEVGVAGITVAIYQLISGSYVLQGSLVTDASGSYSALLPGKGDYIVRVVQPQIDGINAVQTWAKGEYLDEGDGIDSTTPVCWNEGGPVGATDFDGPCFGAKKMPAADPTLGAVGSTADPATFAIYTTATVQSYRDVAEADFGIHAAGSFGDLGPATVATSMPYHINAGAAKPPVWLGETLGSYTEAGNNAKAHASDDGVKLAIICPDNGDCGEGEALNDQLFAQGKDYTFEATVSGTEFNTAKVQGWTATSGSSPIPAAPAWNNTPAWTPGDTGEVRDGVIRFDSSGNYALRVNASPLNSAITRPTNSAYEYYDSAKNGAVAWVTFGEIEDYQFRVVGSVARPALKTSGGLGSATISSPMGTDSWSRELSANGGPKLGMPGVALSGKYTVSDLTADFEVLGVVAKDSLTGAEVAGVITGFVSSTTGATFTYTPQNFSDVILEVTMAKKPDPGKSTIELLTPAGVSVGSTQEARATVVESGGVAMAGVEVSFTSTDSDLTMCPADAVSVDAATCFANTMTCTTDDAGQCSVDVFSIVAATYTEKLSASVLVSGSPVNLGVAPGTKLSPVFTQASVDLKNSTFTVSPVADPADGTKENWQEAKSSSSAGGSYTVTATLKDAYGNGVAGLSDTEVVFSTNTAKATCDNWTASSTAGVYTATCSSTLASAEITASVKVNGVNVTTNTTTVAGDPGAVTALPMPFKPGPIDPSAVCDDPSMVGSGLSVDEDNLPVGETSTATALVTDASCNPISDVIVDFVVDDPSMVTLVVTQAETDSDGKAYAEITGVDAGVVNLTASVDIDGDDVALANSPLPITFTVGAADPAKTEFTVASCAGLTSSTVVANGVDCWMGTIVAKDSTGAVIKNLTADDFDGFTFFVDPDGVVAASSVDFSSASSGAYTVTYTSTVAGSFEASAAVDGKAITGGTGGGVLTFVAGAAKETCTDSTDSGRLGSALWTLSDEVTVGDQAIIHARVTDEFCNPITGAEVDFALVPGSAASFVGSATGTTGSDGLTSATITDSSAETVGVQASTGVVTFLDVTVQVKFTAGSISAANSEFTVAQCDTSAASVVADGVDCWVGTLKPKDELGNTAHVSAEMLAKFAWGAYAAGEPTDLVVVSGVSNNGNGTYSVTYKSTTAGDYSVDLSFDGTSVGATEPISFVAGTPSVVVPESCTDGRPGTRIYGDVYGELTTRSAGESATITALVTDENCNPITGVEVSFAYDSSTAVLSPESATTDANGLAVVSLTGSVAEMVNVTGSIPTDQMIANGSPAQVEFTTGSPTVVVPENCIDGRPGTRIYGDVYGELTTRVAGESATITALVTDENCNPISDVEVGFAHDSSTAEFAVDTATTDANGVATVSLTGTVAETVNVTGSIPTDQVIVNGSPAQVEFTTGSPTVVVPETCDNGLPGTRIYGDVYGELTTRTAGGSATITALVTDENCNPITDVEVSFAHDSSTAEFAVDTAITDANGLATVSLTGSIAELVNVTGSIPTDQMIINGSPAQVEFTTGTPTVVVPENCSNGLPGTRIYGDVYGETTSRTAGESATITALVTDENCNPITGVEVSFAHDSSTASFAVDTATTDANGLATVSLSGAVAEMVNVTGSIPTDQVIINGSPAQVVFTAGSVSAAHSVFTVAQCDTGATSVVADGVECWTGTLKPKDELGNTTHVSAEMLSTFVWGAYLNGEPTDLIAVSGVGNNGDGTYSVTYNSVTAGDYTVDLSFNDSPVGATEPISFVAGTPTVVVPESCTDGRPGTRIYGDVYGETTTRVAGESATITALVTDENCNPISNVEVSFAHDSSTASFTVDTATTDANGLATGSLTGTVAETVNVTASIPTDQMIVNGSPAVVEFTTGAPSVVVPETCDNGLPGTRIYGDVYGETTTRVAGESATITALVADENCNPISNVEVSFAHDSSTASFAVDTATTDANGLATVSLTGTVAETVNVTGSIPTDQVIIHGSPAVVAFTAGSISAANSEFTVAQCDTSAASVVADGVDCWVGTLKPKDELGNTAHVSAEMLAKFAWGAYAAGEPTDLVVVSGVSNNGNGTYSVTYKSTTAGDYSVDLSFNGTPVGATEPISFVAGTPSVVVPESCTDGRPGTRIYGDVYGETTTRVAGESATITALITDENCNPITGVEVSFAFDSSTADLTPESATTDANGLATVSLTGSVAEMVNVTGSIPTDQVIVNGSPAQVEFTAGSPTVVVPENCINGRPGTRIYGDVYGELTTRVAGESATITALVTDENCNPISNVEVSFAHDSSTAVFGSDTETTDENGLATVSLTGTVAELVDVTASIPTDQVIINGSPAQVEFTAGSPTVTVPESCSNGLPGTRIYGEAGYDKLTTKTAGESATITALVTDENCNPISDVEVSFAHDSSTAEFSVDTATTDANGLATVSLTGSVAELVSVTGSIPTDQVIVNGSPAQVEFTTGSPTVVVPETCTDGRPGTRIYGDVYGELTSRTAGESATITALITDENCNPINGVEVSFAHDSSTAEFVVNTATTDANGLATVSLTGSVAETVNVTGSIPTDQVIVNGSPAVVEFTAGSPTVVVPENCSNGLPGTRIYGDVYGELTTRTAGESATITALVTDENCNPITGVEVSFAHDSSTAEFSVDAATTDADGLATVSLAGTVAELVNVTASIPTDQVIVNGSPAVVEFTTGSPTVVVPMTCENGLPGTRIYGEAGYDKLTTKTAGESATITALVTDENCNPINGVEVSFAHDSSTAEFSVDAATTDSNGLATVSLTGTVAELVNVTASIPTNQMIINGSPAVVEFTTGSPTVTVPETCSNGLPGTRIYGEAGYGKVTTKTAGESATITALVTDENCNPISNVEVSFAHDSSTAEFAVDTATTDANGVATVSLTGSVAETVNVTASIPTDQVIVNGSPAQVEFTSGSPTVVVPETCSNGLPGTRIYGEAGYDKLTTKTAGESATITALVTDENCNPITGVEVSFAHDSSTATFAVGSATTDVNGLATVSLTGTVAETVNVTAMIPTAQTITNGSPAQVEFTTGSPTVVVPENCTDGRPGTRIYGDVYGELTSRVAGESATITALVTDENCNPISGVEVSFAHDSTTATFSVDTATTDANGLATVSLTGTVAELVNVTAMIPANQAIINGSPAQVEYTTGGVWTGQCTMPDGTVGVGTNLSANPTSAEVGGNSQITAYVTDEYCNPLTGVAVSFATTGEATFTTATTVETVDGYAYATITDTTAETVNITATAEGTPITTGSPAEVTFLAGAADPSRSSFAVTQCDTTASAVLANGEDCYLGTLTVRDSMDNPLAGLSSEQLALFMVDAPMEVTKTNLKDMGDGTYTIEYTSIVANTYTVGVRYNTATPVQIGALETITFTAGSVELEVDENNCAPGRTGTGLEVTPTTVTTDQSATVRVLVTDAYCNPITGELVNLTVSGNGVLGTTSATTNESGLVETTVSDATAQTVTVHASVAAGTVPSDTDVTFTAGSVDATASGFVVYRSAGNTNPSKVRADGIESWTGEFTPKDAGGNTITQPLAPSVLAELTVVVDARVTVSAGPAGTYTWLFTSETYDVDFDVQLFMGTTKVAPMTTNTIAYTRAVAPEAPVITEPAPGEDINTTTPTVSGENGEPGSTITVTDEDGNVLCTVTAGADGSWSCTVEIPFEEGEHAIIVTAIDSEGNESEADRIEITVDVTPPVKPIITEPAPGESVNTAKPTVAGENGEPGSTITVTDEDGNVLCTVTAGADGSWSCTVEIPLDEGDHTITVTATDSAGNESEADRIEIIVKTVPPTVPVLNPTNGSKVTGWTDADTLITITDAAGKPIVGCIDVEPNAAGEFTCKPAPMVSAGQTIKAVATDRAGNESKVATVVVRGLSSGVTHPERYVGEEQVVTGYNFNPGETVTLVVFSDPLEVGPAVADGDGTVTWTFTIPGDMEVTVHTAMLTGVESGSITTTFEVIAKPVTPEPPAAPEAPAPVVVPTGGVILPSAVLPLALVILGALLALGFVVTTRNRRSTDN